VISTTTCPLDCPDTCGLRITHEAGRITALDGDPESPVTRGFICGKVRRFTDHLYGPDRIATPLIRSGPKGSGSFRPIGWDEAVATITDRLAAIRDRSGGEAILPYHYGGSNGFLSDGLLDRLFFARLGASRLRKTICATPTMTAATGLYGLMPGVAFQDFVCARAIVIWGANPKATHIHLVPFLKEAKRRGAFIAAVDPVRHFSDREIDLHLGLRPGTDLPLALAMINLWETRGDLDPAFIAEHVSGLDTLLGAAREWSPERAAQVTGVPERSLHQLAERFAEADPALIRLGWGMERNTNGGQAAAAVLAIPALLGKFGVRGGGYAFTSSSATRFNAEDVLGPLDHHTREINMTPLARHLTDGTLSPSIEALFVYNGNPVATCPDQNRLVRGLAREDLFTIVHDSVHTDTCDFADIVLPATTFLEHHDIRRGYGNYVVGGVRPLVAPYGEARANHDVFAALGRAFGFTDEAFTWDQETAFRKVVAAISANGSPLDPAPLLAGGQSAVPFPEGTPVQFRDVWPRTSDRRVHLDSRVLGDQPYRFTAVEDPEFPFALITPASAKMVTSTFGNTAITEPRLSMHPRDAARLDLENGSEITVSNRQGSVRVTLHTTEKIAQGVVMIPKGIWRRHANGGATAAALCPDHVERTGGGACFNDARVRVRPAD